MDARLCQKKIPPESWKTHVFLYFISPLARAPIQTTTDHHRCKRSWITGKLESYNLYDFLNKIYWGWPPFILRPSYTIQACPNIWTTVLNRARVHPTELQFGDWVTALKALTATTNWAQWVLSEKFWDNIVTKTHINFQWPFKSFFNFCIQEVRRMWVCQTECKDFWLISKWAYQTD